jgi:hypothetical protein
MTLKSHVISGESGVVATTGQFINLPSLPLPSALFLQVFYQQLKRTPVNESLFGLYCFQAWRVQGDTVKFSRSSNLQ